MADRVEADFRRLARVKARTRHPARAVGPDLLSFFKQQVHKPHARLGKIAGFWEVLVPASVQQHCALEGFTRGTLTVVVDSASHLYDLKQLLLAGLQQQLLLAGRSAGLKKIALKRGQWYDATPEGGTRPRF